MKNSNWQGIVSLLNPYADQLLQAAVYDSILSQCKCIVIFKNDPSSFITTLEPLIKYAAKHKLPTPLIVPDEFVRSSLDSYPLEFINIQSDYQNVLCNDDVLASLKFDKHDVRLEVERELKSKWLLTRTALLELHKHKLHLRKMVQLSVASVVPIIKGLYFLTDTKIPKDLDALVKRAGDIIGFDCSLLTKITAIDTLDVQSVMHYIDLLHTLQIKLDQWQV